MRILGIDPGYATTGFGILQAERASVQLINYGTITTPKYANKSVTAEKLADNIPYTKFGLSADQVRHVYAGTTEPGAELGSDGDIYLKYAE